MSLNLFVANLSHTIRDDELRSLFAVHGTVRTAHVLDQLKTGISTASGLVEMNSQEEAEAAITALNGQAYHGHALKVFWATPRQESSRGRWRAVEPRDILKAAGSGICRGPRPGGFGDRGGHGPRGGRFFVVADPDR
jgi:RNA recognition motif-containing protein